MALDIELPKSIYAHGWITIDQNKMSKSTGNVIAPKTVIDEYELKNPDALRYFMATAAANGKDGNYSDVDFKEKVNADLANNMGNLLNRTLNMLVKYLELSCNSRTSRNQTPHPQDPSVGTTNVK